jgi:hypothetical protein
VYFLLTLFVIITCTTVAILYYIIFIKKQTLNIKLKEEETKLINTNNKIGNNDELFNLRRSFVFSKGLFIIALIFILSVFPISSVVIIDEFKNLS